MMWKTPATAASGLLRPNSKVITPAIVEAFFSSSSELTAAMALIQTVVIGLAIAILVPLIKRASQHGSSSA